MYYNIQIEEATDFPVGFLAALSVSKVKSNRLLNKNMCGLKLTRLKCFTWVHKEKSTLNTIQIIITATHFMQH